MQIYNFSFKPTTFLEKMLIKMLSEYYILQVHLTKSKMRTIATSFNPIFLPIFLCLLIKKLYLCSRIFSKNQALRLIENRIFSKYVKTAVVMSINIKRNQLKRVVIVGGGLGGLRLAEDLCNSNLQVVLIDKNNFHQFPPLIYQIASAGIDPSSISFPFRQIFRKRKNFYFRMAEARAVFPDKKILQTSIGKIEYDYLVFAAGTTTNFYGNANIEKWAIPMKTVSEAMGLRNAVLSNLERALTCATEEERQELLNVVIVGGGATGVEIAGALSEMKRYVIPYDYPDMDSSLMHIYLLEAGDRLLAGMSQDSSKKAYEFLTSMGVDVQFGKMVTDYKDHKVLMKDGQEIPTRTFLWVSGVKAQPITGIDGDHLGRGFRIVVDEFNRIPGMDGLFAIGDQCIQTTDPAYPGGHPQLAQVAIQQAALLAKNIQKIAEGATDSQLKPFRYKNLGSMAIFYLFILSI